MKKSINLNSQEWCDVVFKDKNKSYGAYELRMTSSKRHIIAFASVLLLTACVIILPMLITKVSAANKTERGEAEDAERILSVVDYEEPIEDIIDLSVPEPPKINKEEVINSIAFTPPIIGEDTEVAEDIEVKTIDEIMDDPRVIGHKDVSDGTDNLDAKLLKDEKIIVDEPVAPTIFEFVEMAPQFPGGNDEMMRYIRDNLRYPVIDQQEGRQGRVIVRFVVSKTGEIEQVKVQKGVSPSCDREAIRVVKGMPKWIPGKQNGAAVAVYFTLPILYRLQ